MNRKAWILCAALVLTALCLAGGSLSTAETTDAELPVYGGFTVYDNPALDSVALVEFSFGFNRSDLEFFRPDSADTNWYSRVFAAVRLFDQEGYAIDSAQTYFSVMAPTLEVAAVKDYMIFDKLKMYIHPGKYSATLNVIDVVNKRKGELFLGKFTIDSLNKTDLLISGTQLAFGISYVGDEYYGGNPRLVRNGYLLIPNPTGIFRTTDSVVYLYGEVYNCAYTEGEESQVKVSYAAKGNDSVFYKAFGEKLITKPGESLVLAQNFSTQGWPAGGYQLEVTVEDLATGKVATREVPFYRVTPDFIAFASSERGTYDPWDSLTVEKQRQVTLFHLGDEQRQVLSRLSVEGIRTFLNQYWREHDSDPSTLIIENRLEAISRWSYANEHFYNNEARDDGWQSDRGRVLIVYGMPDEIEDRDAPRVGNPFQVWHYYHMGEGKVFVFEDWSGSHDFRLVHSNVFGEIYNGDWEELLREGYMDLEER